MTRTECPNCREPVPILAPACGYCGVPNPARRNAVIAAAALASLGLAIVVAVLVVLLSGGSRDQGEVRTSAGTDNYAWLENAMKQCDGEAAKLPDALHFLVTPLVDEPRDEPGWRRASLNDIGNAILINSENTLAGLRRKALRISSEEYAFSLRDEASKQVLTWKAAVGVRKFVATDAKGIGQFKIQFQSLDAVRGINWGTTFNRQPGNCYWVNAILRN